MILKISYLDGNVILLVILLPLYFSRLDNSSQIRNFVGHSSSPSPIIVHQSTEASTVNPNYTSKWNFRKPGIILSDYQLIITIAFFLGLVFVGSSLLTAVLCLIKKRKCPFLPRQKEKFRTPKCKPSEKSISFIEKPNNDGNMSIDFGISDLTPLVPPSESEKYDILSPLPTGSFTRLQSKCEPIISRCSASQPIRNSVHVCQSDNDVLDKSNSSFNLATKTLASSRLLFPSSSKQSLNSVDKSLLSLEHTSRIASPDFEQVKMQFKHFTDQALSQNCDVNRHSSSLTNIYEKEYRERDGKKMEPSIPTPCILPNSEESESEKSVY